MKLMKSRFAKISTGSLLILLFVVSGAFAQDKANKTDKAKEHFNEGLKLEQSGMDTLALIEYRAAVENDPNYADAYLNMGSIQFNHNKYQEALENFKKATELEPGSADAWANLGRVNFKLKNYIEAENAYKKALEINPDYNEVHKDMGLLYYNQKNWPALVENMEAFTSKVKDDYLAYYLLGKGYQKLKKTDKATADLKKTIELNPDYFNGWNTLGQIYQSQERYQQAFDAYKKAVQLDPNNYRAVYNMAISYQSLNMREDGYYDNIDNIIGYWNQFLKVAKKNPKAKSLIPQINETIDGLKEMKDYLQENAG